MTDPAARPSRAWRATRRLATALPIAAVLAVTPVAAQAHSEDFVPGHVFTPGESFTPGKSGFEADFGAGRTGQEMNLIVHAVVGGLPFEVIDFEPR